MEERQLLNGTPSTTVLTSTLNPALAGQSVEFWADVRPASGSGSPTGSVLFEDGTTELGTATLQSGPMSMGPRATFTTSGLALGTHSITAVYQGDSVYDTSTDTLSETINQATTSTSLSSDTNPATAGTLVTFTATVSSSSGTPSGTVKFQEGNTVLGTGTLGGGMMGNQATFSTSTLGSGIHSITAVFDSTAAYAGSTSSALTETINPASGGGSSSSTTTSLSSSLNPASAGNAVTFTANVSAAAGGTPSGTVTFLDGTSPLATVTLTSSMMSGAQAGYTTSSLGAGAHTITAQYSGDSINQGSSSSPLTETVNRAATSTAMGANPSPAWSGQTVTLTASVSGYGSTPSGTVSFFDGQTLLGTGTLAYVMAGMQASLTTSSLGVGSHSLTAVYNGDSACAPSTSMPVSETVNNALVVQPVSVSAVEGTALNGVAVATFQDLAGNSDPSDYSATLDWGDGTTPTSATLTPQMGNWQINGSHTYVEAGSYTIHVALVDADGSSGQVDATAAVADAPLSWAGGSLTLAWTMNPVASPVLTNPGNQTSAEGDSVSLPLTATDPNGYGLTWDAVDLPPGLTISTSTGRISGSVDYAAAEDFGGQYQPTVIVADGHGGSASTTFSYTITDTPRAPTLTSPGDQSSAAGQDVSLQVTGTDPDGNDLTYDATGLPSGLGMDDTGLISGTIDPAAASTTPYSITVTADDGFSKASQSFSWTVTAANLPPKLTSPGDQSNAVGDAVALDLSGSDPKGGQLTYTAEGLPAGLSIDPVSGTVSGTPEAAAASTTPYTVTVSASNGTTTTSQSFAWTISGLSLDNPGDQANIAGESVSLPLSASTTTGGTLNYSVTGLPDGLGIDPDTGLISGTVSPTAVLDSPYPVTVTVSDGTYSTSQSLQWSVAALALHNPGDQGNVEGEAVSLKLTAADLTGTPTYSATGLPAGLSIDASTGQITGTIGLAAHGRSPYQVTVTAHDGTSSVSQSLVWTVSPRVLLANPGSQRSAAGDAIALQVMAYARAGGTLSYSVSGLPSGLTIDSNGLISGTLASDTASASPYRVTVTVSDGTASNSQTFPWSVAPLVLLSPGDQENLDGDSVALTLASSYHGSGTLSFSTPGLPPGLSLDPNTGHITGTLADTADTDSPYAISVAVTNGTVTDSQTFNWSVSPRVSLNPITNQASAVGDVVSLSVSGSAADSGTLVYSATGLPAGLSIDSSSGDITGTIDPGADVSSPSQVTVTATEGSSSASRSFAWSVAPLALVNPGTQRSVDGQSITLALQGHAAAGASLTYSVTGLPPGLVLDPNTGHITGTVAAGADGGSGYLVTITASDGSHSALQTFEWDVTQVGVSDPGDQTVQEGQAVALQLQGLGVGTLAYSISHLPPGLSFNTSTALISGTLAAGDAAAGPYTSTVVVTNGTASAWRSVTWNVTPYVTLTAPADQTTQEGEAVALQLRASDAGNASLTYTADGLPDGLTLDTSTGLISGTPAAGDALAGWYMVLVTASDGTYRNSQTLIWTISPSEPVAPPTLLNPGPQGGQPGDGVNLQLQATDPAGYLLTYSVTGLPDGLDIDPYTGIISGNLAEDAASSAAYSVTVTVDNGVGGTTSETFPWVVLACPFNAQGASFTSTEGKDTGTVTVATFNSSNLHSEAGAYTALVDWGDGQSDTGTVDGSGESYKVSDNHLYAKSGIYTVRVVLTTRDGRTSQVEGIATVLDAPLTLSGGFDLAAIHQQPATLTLAWLTDASTDATASDYTASIDWGDGSRVDSGSLGKPEDGVVPVSGAHAYGHDGSYTITVLLTDIDGATATTTSTVTVGDIYAGIPSTLQLSSFLDGNLGAPSSDFTATIDWGDGTAMSVPGITGANGTYTLQSLEHTYLGESRNEPGGVYAVKVKITDDDGSVLLGTRSVCVVRPPLSGTGQVLQETPEVALNNVEVATFTDADRNDTSSEFAAMIDWGDGSPVDSHGTVSMMGGIGHVFGSHTYTRPGGFPLEVQVVQYWGLPSLAMRLEGDVVGEDKGGANLAPSYDFVVGPDVVPGNSRYLFQFTAPKGASNVEWSSGNSPTATIRNIPDLLASLEEGQSVKYRAEVTFKNSPAFVDVTVTYDLGSEKHIKRFRRVAVVEVSLSEGKWKSEGTSVRREQFPSPLTSTTPDLLLQWQRRVRNESPEARWMFFAMQTFLRKRGPMENLWVEGSGPDEAMRVTTDVTLVPPTPAAGEPPVNITTIHVGYIQMVRMQGSGENSEPPSVPAQRRKFTTSTEYALDRVKSIWPYYSASSGLFTPANATDRTRTITYADNPDGIMPETVAPGSAVKITRGYWKDNFSVYVVASTGSNAYDSESDSASPDYYFDEGHNEWSADFAFPFLNGKNVIHVPGMSGEAAELDWKSTGPVPHSVIDVTDIVPATMAIKLPYATWE